MREFYNERDKIEILLKYIYIYIWSMFELEKLETGKVSQILSE